MSAALKTLGSFFRVPQVSQAEIESFHDAHFSNASIGHFDFQFFRPENAEGNSQYYEENEEYYEEYYEEDDGLGYYPDGVKRTLTDEQIAIFRHSEIEALRRVESKADKLRKESAALLQAAKEEDASNSISDSIPQSPTNIKAENSDKAEIKEEEDGEVQDGSEDGEIEVEQPQLTKAEIRRQKRQRSKRKKQDQRKFNPEKKPDLRKRTWDVVEAGMDSLDYDEFDGAQDASATPAAQRRRISYDD
ncbi:uncharacterized protein F4822DRAFT_426029 [Hypoxylon trugodes]|uniref:uncharacterized protein n=1 Tax=Hypoxylon trugodes TaxID=326681 RepID=UPI00218CA243|nr:uncharacterized protein F4822DRAFT_426029 [Hypoxylon trugodes]KAI1392825.1 hypothetical protein F4822DRAFT_426029 [Hypoxylon trugodes]